MRTREEAMAMLETLSSYGVITYSLGEERRGENGPHLEIRKGPRFAEGLPAEAPREYHWLLEALASGWMQRRVDETEGRATTNATQATR